ncbi:hypothetical protein EV363DRAFT_1418421 [Boletus edulis]|nr:hypothetical protein EV363DRAFT_1418421 [Boletus edulis]
MFIEKVNIKHGGMLLSIFVPFFPCIVRDPSELTKGYTIRNQDAGTPGSDSTWSQAQAVNFKYAPFGIWCLLAASAIIPVNRLQHASNNKHTAFCRLPFELSHCVRLSFMLIQCLSVNVEARILFHCLSGDRRGTIGGGIHVMSPQALAQGRPSQSSSTLSLNVFSTRDAYDVMPLLFETHTTHTFVTRASGGSRESTWRPASLRAPRSSSQATDASPAHVPRRQWHHALLSFELKRALEWYSQASDARRDGLLPMNHTIHLNFERPGGSTLDRANGSTHERYITIVPRTPGRSDLKTSLDRDRVVSPNGSTYLMSGPIIHVPYPIRAIVCGLFCQEGPSGANASLSDSGGVRTMQRKWSRSRVSAEQADDAAFRGFKRAYGLLWKKRRHKQEKKS